jgi:hypothetical protein
MTLSMTTLSIMCLFATLSIDTQHNSIECNYAQCRYAECRYAEYRAATLQAFPALSNFCDKSQTTSLEGST